MFFSNLRPHRYSTVHMHYYGSIQLYGIDSHPKGKPNITTNRGKEEWKGIWRESVMRKIITEERDLNGDLIGQIGDRTNRFNHPKDVWKALKRDLNKLAFPEDFRVNLNFRGGYKYDLTVKETLVLSYSAACEACYITEREMML